MNCRDVEMLLQLASDGEITEAERAALDAHLGGCLACRRKEAWLELLAHTYPDAAGPPVGEEMALADRVVGQMKAALDSAALPSMAIVQATAGHGRPPEKGKKGGRKRGILARAVAAIWSRRQQKQARKRRQKARAASGWIDASVTAMLPPPTSLETFRAAKRRVDSAVSGPVRALRWVAGVWPRRGHQ